MNAADEYADPVGGAAPESDFDRQEIRLAVVLNGGVSLAVWMSGVTLELHRLATVRRRTRAAYLPLLDLLQAEARVDVIAGTSAGGINGAFLALGLARPRELAGLRDLWCRDGSLEKLLRSPLRKNPPSLLMGDEYFLPKLRSALRTVLDSPPLGDGGEAARDVAAHPVELILTGTLWEGRTTSFTDDMGTGITEVDHDATFRFAAPADGTDTLGDLTADEVVEKLAVASRCTSSFPGAFEPHWVAVTASPAAAGEGPWPSTAGGANFRQSQYVLDGGVLLNKPIRPALEAVYRQPGGVQVRRVLAYVVPDPAETTALPAQVPTAEDLPHARDALLGVLTRLRSTDSVSRELTEIRTRNEAVQFRRRARDRLAAAMTGGAEDLSERAWSGYVDVRIDYAARTIGGLVAAGQPVGEHRWSPSELDEVLRGLIRQMRGQDGSFVPADPLATALTRTGGDWDWGMTTVERLADMAVDVLRRALQLSPMGSPQRREIVEARRGLGATLEDIHRNRRLMDLYWAGAPGREYPRAVDGAVDECSRMPMRESDRFGKVTNRDMLQRWLGRVVDGWVDSARSENEGADPRQRQYELAGAVAEQVRTCRQAIGAVVRTSQLVEAERVESQWLEALHDYLFGPVEGSADDGPVEGPGAAGEAQLLQRMLRLDVVQLAFSGASQDVEQEVELVQFSSMTPQLLTGKQLHHFGAFYRPSWRVNDWLHGRMDGSAHIVRMLLSPDRLRQCGTVTADDGPSPADRAADLTTDRTADRTADRAAERIAELRRRRVDELLGLIRACALATGPKGDRDRGWLAERWEAEDAAECRRFIESIVTVVPPDAPDAPGPTGAPAPSGADQAGSLPGPDGDVNETAGDANGLAGLHACVRAVCRSAQTGILREDLDALADSIRGEGDSDRTRDGRIWLELYDAKRNAAGGTLRTEDLWQLWWEAERIGGERIPDDAGSDTFARTVAHAAAAAANTATSQKLLRPRAGRPGLPRFRPVGIILAAFRGYTLMVWGMVVFLTRRSRFGTRAVELALAAGGVLLACAVLVPALPMAFTLAGVLLLLAGASTAALWTPGARTVGRRLLALAVPVAAGMGYVVWEWVHRSPKDAESALIRIGVGLLVVLAGWWVARSQREPRPDSTAGRLGGAEQPRPAVAVASAAGAKDGGSADGSSEEDREAAA
ncbi:patatin-like protein [Saccharothrix sp. ST-888]|uniref:patatin-like protein n=1 Tax=Saccharothrix sp. ST-888 TaxID=1427391 RepID=UPI0018CD94F8|nr:patatin-like protein [Saccharothrix sp. ST-888]